MKISNKADESSKIKGKDINRPGVPVFHSTGVEVDSLGPNIKLFDTTMYVFAPDSKLGKLFIKSSLYSSRLERQYCP